MEIGMIKLTLKNALCLFILLFLPLKLMSQPLQLVTLQYPPYEYQENGEIKGVVIDLVTEIFNRMNKPIEISVLPWARALDYIEKGSADAIFTAYKTPERETFADYSTEVLMPQVVSLFTNKDANISFDGHLKQLKDVNFGVVNKVSYGKKVDLAIQRKVLSKVQKANSGELNMKKLLAGRIDVLVSNKYGAWDILKKLNKQELVTELSPEVQNVPSYMAFSKKRNLTHIRDKFDFILKEMKLDGSYNKIIKAYFK